jgi:hypothetical protein
VGRARKNMATTLHLNISMKFDRIVMNPPYNPNAVWAKFVETAMDSLKDDGKLVAIHPSTWRESTKYDKLAEKLKTGISELHIMDFTAFKENKIDIKTDWYVWQKNYVGEQIIKGLNGKKETINLREQNRIVVSTMTSNIIKKITSNKKNGCISLIYNNNINNHPTGTYRQCGGIGNTLGWTVGNFVLSKNPTKHQTYDKVVMAYTGAPRAKFFPAAESVGVGLAIYWLTNNKNLPTLLNSKMLWKVMFSVLFQEGSKRHKGGIGILHHPIWLLEILNFDGLIATNEQELYKHYNLTQEEIEWCEM